MGDDVAKRKEALLKYFKGNENLVYYLLLGVILIYSYLIRIQNLPLLKDVTTGKYIPVALDPHVFLRYAREILNGTFSGIDLMRYVPLGYNPHPEFNLLTYFIVYFYKFLHFFNPAVTLEYADVIYPPVMFVIGMIVFFFLVKLLFKDNKIALLSTAFLSVLPTYLYRTTAGFADKEALALAFFFMTLFFYVYAWKSKSAKESIIWGMVAGITTLLMAFTWGGVGFLFLILSGFALVEILLDKFSKNDFYTYSAWFLTFLVLMTLSGWERYSVLNLVSSTTSGIMFLAFVVGLIRYLIKEKNVLNLNEKIKNKMPIGLFSFTLTLGLGIVFTSIFIEPLFIINKLFSIYSQLNNVPNSRWILTVAESHQPYIIDWINQFSGLFFWMFMIGSILLFYNMVKPIKEYKSHLTVAYSLFLLAFTFSRYKSNSVLNGETNLALALYLGSLIFFLFGGIWFYIHSFKKSKHLFNELLKINKFYTFVFVWFFVCLVSARSAVRLILMLAPIASILVSYLLIEIYNKGLTHKDKFVKAIVISICLALILFTLYGFTTSSSQQAKFTGPSYNQQWQVAMNWVRENTPQDSVFAHWWDYGYWVQTGGERATISDGGNARDAGAINYFTGRNLLTAPNYTDALDFLYANNATHVLIISDDIGKYGAYSSIGADANYDRYSWLTTFRLDPTQIEEKRDISIFKYFGNYPFDDDIIYEGKVLPAREAGVAVIELPVELDKSGSVKSVAQPKAIVGYQGQRYDLNLGCIFMNNKEIKFKKDDLDGACLRIIPVIQGNQMNPLGAGIYLSRDVAISRFTRLYLFNEETENFKRVYDDSAQMPLSVFNGRLIGPLKIWEVTYPKGQVDYPVYREGILPDPRVKDV